MPTAIALSEDLIAIAYQTWKTASPSMGGGNNPGICPECLTVVNTTTRHDEPSYWNKYRVLVRDYLTVIHGPRNNRCPGSRRKPVTWTEAAGLPTWDDMCDLDRGAALMFLWKCRWERSYAYARENYPCRYIVDPRLAVLSEREACRHAGIVAGTFDEACDLYGEDEVHRLYNLALEADR